MDIVVSWPRGIGEKRRRGENSDRNDDDTHHVLSERRRKHLRLVYFGKKKRLDQSRFDAGHYSFFRSCGLNGVI